jgi:hypothetical protein
VDLAWVPTLASADVKARVLVDPTAPPQEFLKACKKDFRDIIRQAHPKWPRLAVNVAAWASFLVQFQTLNINKTAERVREGKMRFPRRVDKAKT